jgi:hypothetical protein
MVVVAVGQHQRIGAGKIDTEAFGIDLQRTQLAGVEQDAPVA